MRRFDQIRAIAMQTAKNLFLGDGRFAIRKALELPLAMWMDLIWSKRRMIEVYLNIVEWAPGVYGAEAAARHHFGKSAKNITKTEAARPGGGGGDGLLFRRGGGNGGG